MSQNRKKRVLRRRRDKRDRPVLAGDRTRVVHAVGDACGDLVRERQCDGSFAAQRPDRIDGTARRVLESKAVRRQRSGLEPASQRAVDQRASTGVTYDDGV